MSYSKTQKASLRNVFALPQKHPQSEQLASYLTWFSSSAAGGLCTIFLAAFLAQQTQTPVNAAPVAASKIAATVAPAMISPVKTAVATPAPTIKPALSAPDVVIPQTIKKTIVPQLAAPAATAKNEKTVLKPVAAAPRPERETLSLELTSGNTIVSILTKQGISHAQAVGAVNAMSKVFNPKKLQAGQEICLKLRHKNDNSTLEKMSMRVNPMETVTVQKSAGKFLAEKAKIETERKLSHAGGAIAGSFYQTGIRQGLSPQMISELINAFSYDVDFQRDIKAGQQMHVLFENLVDDSGKVVKKEGIKYASLDIKGKKIEIYRYKDSFGRMGFFHANGESIRKSLLKTPVNGARISSGFGMREHPILGYSKMHKGMDFAAPTGTPVYAAGDGIVRQASPFGSYGNYLCIKHNGTYATAYGHLSRFAPNIRPGVRVKQGQVVAYIGTTGRSTGPHLHYEVLKYNAQVNPALAKFNAGNFLEGRDMVAFKQNIHQLKTKLASLLRGKTQLASAN
jgi:murein DD-endopeptidase MepM/ murein hydrolase activator NlpD